MLVLDAKQGDANIPNSINSFIEHDTKTYIQSVRLYSSIFTNYLAIKALKMCKCSILWHIGFVRINKANE